MCKIFTDMDSSCFWMLALSPCIAMQANLFWLFITHSAAGWFHQHIGCGPCIHPHIPFVVLFPAGLAYFLFPSLVFLFVFSMSLFSIWNLFYSLYGSIDPLSYRPPASWCPLFTVTQAIIACGHFWLFQCWLWFSQLMPCSRLVYHREHPEGSLAFCFGQMIDSKAWTERRKAAKLAH